MQQQPATFNNNISLSIVTNQNQQFQQQNLQIQIVGHAQQQHAASVVTDNDVTMTDNSVQQQQQLPQYYSLPSMYWYAESAVVRDTYNNLQSERQTLSAANKQQNNGADDEFGSTDNLVALGENGGTKTRRYQFVIPEDEAFTPGTPITPQQQTTRFGSFSSASVAQTQPSTSFVKQMTSFIKSVLLSKYVTRKGISIMDIGCGRGHDIKKWRLYEPKSIALVDVSESNLGAAENMLARTPFGPDCNPEKLIINTDFCVPLPTEWNLSNKFNVVQMHSVLQYMLFSDDAAKQMLKNVFNVLTADGVFICTVPDGSKIHSHLVNKGQLVTASDNTQYVKYDNKHYSVQARREYLRENPAMLLGTSSAATGQPETLRQEPIRGMPYLFMLRTQVGDLQPRVFSAHEYIVLLHDFINMAYEAGFQVSLRETFASFLSFELSNNKNSNLMRRMNLTSDDMNIDKLRSENREDDVSFLDLHSVLVFVKRVDML